MKHFFRTIILGVFIFFLFGCGSNSNVMKIKNYKNYDGIGLYDSKKKSKLDNNIRMIQIEDDDKNGVKVDLKLCGFTKNVKKDISFSGGNPFEGKYISRCCFFNNYAFFLCSKAEINVMEEDYDIAVYYMTNASILRVQSSNDSLYVLSLRTGNFYDLGEAFSEIDVSNKNAEGTDCIAIKGNRKGETKYYLLREENNDVILKVLPSQSEILFLDKYNNIYYGNAGLSEGPNEYIKNNDSSLTLTKLPEIGIGSSYGGYHWGLNLNNECYYCGMYVEDLFGAITGYQNGFQYGKYDDGIDLQNTKLALVNKDGNVEYYQASDINDLRWRIASCAIYDIYSKSSYIIDDKLYAPIGTYKIIREENNKIGYKLEAITEVFEYGLGIDSIYGSNLNGAVCINNNGLVLFDEEVVSSCVNDFKEKASEGEQYFREFMLNYKKTVDTEGINMIKLENRVIADKIVIYFEGYKDGVLCWGHLDDNFKPIIGSIIGDNKGSVDATTIIIHKIN